MDFIPTRGGSEIRDNTIDPSNENSRLLERTYQFKQTPIFLVILTKTGMDA